MHDELAKLEPADHALPVQSEDRGTIIRTMLMVLTVLSPWKALNVTSFRLHSEDSLCGIVIHYAEHITVLGLNLHSLTSLTHTHES